MISLCNLGTRRGYYTSLSSVTAIRECSANTHCHIHYNITDRSEDFITQRSEFEYVDVCYLDFAKCFDKLDFNLILQRLEHLGIRGRVQQWIETFLKGRKQRVKVNGELGSETEVLSGVPQGTILGPLLFILFISPMPSIPEHSHISSYADDTKLVKGRNNQDVSKLQQDLEQIYQWVNQNNMALNGDKFRVITYGASSDMDIITLSDPNAQSIDCVSSIRDLGVTLQSDGKITQQLHEKVTKGAQMCGWIFRTFKTREKSAMLTLYKSLVLPHLEYCSVIWAPSTVADLQKLERVQRLLTRNIKDLRSYSYWERLRILQLYSLERRNERYQIIYIFKCLHDLVPNPGVSFQYSDRQGYHMIWIIFSHMYLTNPQYLV